MALSPCLLHLLLHVVEGRFPLTAVLVGKLLPPSEVRVWELGVHSKASESLWGAFLLPSAWQSRQLCLGSISLLPIRKTGAECLFAAYEVGEKGCGQCF